MPVYGFNENKSKREVPSKEKDTCTTVNFSKLGTATIVRRGNVVCIRAEATISPSTYVSAVQNYASLPTWAFPSADLMGSDIVLVSSASSSANVYGQLILQTETARISLSVNNTDTAVQTDLGVLITYVVD